MASRTPTARATRIPALAVMALLATTAAHGASTDFQAGYYSNLHYVLSASISGSGQCIDAVGTYFTSVSYYPGPAKKGFLDWRPFNSATFLGEAIVAFPVTQAAGVATWSGTTTTTLQPGGTKSTATFSTTVSYADAHSSVSTTTYTYPVSGGGTCTTTQQSNLSPTGK